MSGWFRHLFAPREPAVMEATAADAAGFAALHATAFRRGWSEQEMERLLIERNVVAHRASLGRTICGFVLSRIAADEAEILSVAVERRQRGRGVARRLLDVHLRQLASLGVGAVFLEVEEGNVPALRLYARAGFKEAGRREAYYPQAGGAAAALVLRRDLL